MHKFCLILKPNNMENIKIIRIIERDSNPELIFRKSEDPRIPSSLQIGDLNLLVDFEFHCYGPKITVLREFHINHENPLVRAYEQALFNYLVSMAEFELCYEDGIPCLTKTFNS